jgi:hypothetical protein
LQQQELASKIQIFEGVSVDAFWNITAVQLIFAPAPLNSSPFKFEVSSPCPALKFDSVLCVIGTRIRYYLHDPGGSWVLKRANQSRVIFNGFVVCAAP